MELTTELSLANGQGIANQAASVANEVSGKPYIWGGKTSDGFDCSGFVAYVLAGLYPNMSARFSTNVAGYMSNDLFDDIDEAERAPGDIIIFPATGGSPNHIGFVYDAKHWIGSQSSTGVAKVKFTNGYWGSRPRKYRRLRPLSIAPLSMGRGTRTLTRLA